jgi:hypothetical protein
VEKFFEKRDVGKGEKERNERRKLGGERKERTLGKKE